MTSRLHKKIRTIINRRKNVHERLLTILLCIMMEKKFNHLLYIMQEILMCLSISDQNQVDSDLAPRKMSLVNKTYWHE